MVGIAIDDEKHCCCNSCGEMKKDTNHMWAHIRHDKKTTGKNFSISVYEMYVYFKTNDMCI